MSGPGEVVSVETLQDKKGQEYLDKVVINRVEYSDGSISDPVGI